MPALAHRVQFLELGPTQPAEGSHSSLHRSHSPILPADLERTINESLNDILLPSK